MTQTMKHSIYKTILVISCFFLLASCGSGVDTPCGAKSQTFGINFEKLAYKAKVGEELKIESQLIPESCRTEASFSVKSGELPIGMTIVDGHIFGTPTSAGIYEFQIYLTAVKNYEDLKQYIESGLIEGPFSNKIKVTVSE
jgi:hypothetical protein